MVTSDSEKKAESDSVIRRIEQMSYRWTKVIVIICGSFILISVLMVAVDVGGRYIINKPLTGAVELESTLLSFIAFLGLAYGLIKGTHVRMTILFDKFPRTFQFIAEMLVCIIGLALFGILTWTGIRQFWDSLIMHETISYAVKVPFWPAKLALPVGTFLMFIQLIIYMLQKVDSMLLRKES